MEKEHIAKLILEFANKPRSLAFVGAGVGCRVGYPSWPSWLDSLADVCTKYNDGLSSELIKKRVSDGDLLGAATVYKTCGEIPVGDRYSQLAKAFRCKPKRIERLVLCQVIILG